MIWTCCCHLSSRCRFLQTASIHVRNSNMTIIPPCCCMMSTPLDSSVPAKVSHLFTNKYPNCGNSWNCPRHGLTIRTSPGRITAPPLETRRLQARPQQRYGNTGAGRIGCCGLAQCSQAATIQRPQRDSERAEHCGIGNRFLTYFHGEAVACLRRDKSSTFDPGSGLTT